MLDVLGRKERIRGQRTSREPFDDALGLGHCEPVRIGSFHLGSGFCSSPRRGSKAAHSQSEHVCEIRQGRRAPSFSLVAAQNIQDDVASRSECRRLCTAYPTLAAPLFEVALSSNPLQCFVNNDRRKRNAAANLSSTTNARKRRVAHLHVSSSRKTPPQKDQDLSPRERRRQENAQQSIRHEVFARLQGPLAPNIDSDAEWKGVYEFTGFPRIGGEDVRPPSRNSRGSPRQ